MNRFYARKCGNLSLAVAVCSQRQTRNIDSELNGPLVKRGQIILYKSKNLICGTCLPDRLVPSAGKGFGNRVKVDARVLEAPRVSDAGNTIVLTKTVEQSRHRF